MLRGENPRDARRGVGGEEGSLLAPTSDKAGGETCQCSMWKHACARVEGDHTEEWPLHAN